MTGPRTRNPMIVENDFVEEATMDAGLMFLPWALAAQPQIGGVVALHEIP